MSEQQYRFAVNVDRNVLEALDHYNSTEFYLVDKYSSKILGTFAITLIDKNRQVQAAGTSEQMIRYQNQAQTRDLTSRQISGRNAEGNEYMHSVRPMKRNYPENKDESNGRKIKQPIQRVPCCLDSNQLNQGANVGFRQHPLIPMGVPNVLNFLPAESAARSFYQTRNPPLLEEFQANSQVTQLPTPPRRQGVFLSEPNRHFEMNYPMTETKTYSCMDTRPAPPSNCSLGVLKNQSRLQMQPEVHWKPTGSVCQFPVNSVQRVSEMYQMKRSSSDSPKILNPIVFPVINKNNIVPKIGESGAFGGEYAVVDCAGEKPEEILSPSVACDPGPSSVAVTEPETMSKMIK